MSRGLSRQQRAILGIAVHANRLTQGGTLAVKGYTTGASVSPACAAIVVHTGVTDLQWPLAAHLVEGLPFVEQATMIQRRNGTVQVAGNFFDLTTPQAKSAKASILRAIAGLWRAGLLALAPHNTLLRCGYVLTEDGLRVGVRYEQPFPPALLWRAGLVLFPAAAGDRFYQIDAALRCGALTLATVIETCAGLPCGPWDLRFREIFAKAFRPLLASVGGA